MLAEPELCRRMDIRIFVDTDADVRILRRILRDVEDIAICRLTGSDVVRHVIVQRIIKAYEDDENKRKAKR